MHNGSAAPRDITVGQLAPDHGPVYVDLGHARIDAGEKLWVRLSAPVEDESYATMIAQGVVIRITRTEAGGYRGRPLALEPYHYWMLRDPDWTPDAAEWAQVSV